MVELGFNFGEQPKGPRFHRAKVGETHHPLQTRTLLQQKEDRKHGSLKNDRLEGDGNDTDGDDEETERDDDDDRGDEHEEETARPTYHYRYGVL